MPIKITESVLIYNGACSSERERFVKEFPDGLELTVENIDLARSKGFQIWLPGICLYEEDLSGADLSGAKLFGAWLGKVNLSKACLIGANLSNTNLSNANLSSSNLSNANLSGADLTGANLTGADLGDWERGSDGFARRKS